MVFHDGFQLETIEEARLKKAVKTQLQQTSQNAAGAISTSDMMSQLKNLKVGDAVHPDMNSGSQN